MQRTVPVYLQLRLKPSDKPAMDAALARIRSQLVEQVIDVVVTSYVEAVEVGAADPGVFDRMALLQLVLTPALLEPGVRHGNDDRC